LLTEMASWRWVMFVNVPIGAAVWLVGRVVLQETPTRHRRLDLFGAVTSTAGMGGVILGLVEAGAAGWTDPVSLGAFALGALMLAVFVHNEGRVDEPILPLRLFAHATRTTGNVARGLVYAGFYGMFFFMSQYLQDVRALSPVMTGFVFLPIPLAIFASSQLMSRVLVKVMPHKVLMLSGTGATATAMGLATMLGPHTSYEEIIFWLVLLGTGAGVAMVSLMSASLADVAPGDEGAASGLVNVSQQLGAALGLAVLVAFFGALSRHGQIGPAQVAGYVHALDDVFALAAGLTVLALVLIAAFVRTLRAPAHATADTTVTTFASEEGRQVLEEVPVLAEAG
ncbi:MAG: MFS transporter, partial [Acidimicrobiales bacterium]